MTGDVALVSPLEAAKEITSPLELGAYFEQAFARIPKSECASLRRKLTAKAKRFGRGTSGVTPSFINTFLNEIRA